MASRDKLEVTEPTLVANLKKMKVMICLRPDARKMDSNLYQATEALNTPSIMKKVFPEELYTLCVWVVICWKYTHGTEEIFCWLITQ